MLVLSDLMFLCFEAVRLFYAPIDVKQNTSLLLTVLGIFLFLDTCMAEVSYLGDMLTRQYCFLFLSFKTCLQRQSQHHAKKK